MFVNGEDVVADFFWRSAEWYSFRKCHSSALSSVSLHALTNQEYSQSTDVREREKDLWKVLIRIGSGALSSLPLTKIFHIKMVFKHIFCLIYNMHIGAKNQHIIHIDANNNM